MLLLLPNERELGCELDNSLINKGYNNVSYGEIICMSANTPFLHNNFGNTSNNTKYVKKRRKPLPLNKHIFREEREVFTGD